MPEFVLKNKEFDKITSMVYDLCSLNLHGGKKPLVEARLAKRLRALGLTSYDAYIAYVKENDDELRTMINCLTTNYTRFFREPEHFDFLRDRFFKEVSLSGARKLRIWSAGCSSGEEPYSIAMEMSENLDGIGRMDALILASDISSKALDKAKEGVYPADSVKNVPAGMRTKYLGKVPGKEQLVQVNQSIKDLIRFRYINLMTPWPMKGRFDAVFCRNVMIYFDKETQHGLIERFRDVIRPGGVLIVGHCESLAGMSYGFETASPTVYRKT